MLKLLDIETQIKTAVRHHLTLVRRAVIKLERREPSYTVGRNVNRYSHYGERYGGSLKTKTRANVRSSNPTSRHVSGKNSNPKRYMHPMFVPSLFTIARTCESESRSVVSDSL